eukprot:4777973-Prymnesium_polylepis.1
MRERDAQHVECCERQGLNYVLHPGVPPRDGHQQHFRKGIPDVGGSVPRRGVHPHEVLGPVKCPLR